MAATPIRWPPGVHFSLRETRPLMTDELALIQRVKRRDEAAFAELYDRFGSLVFGVAKRVLGSVALAEEVAQSVFAQLWERPDDFAGGSFTAWVARVARNASLDILKSSYERTRLCEMPVSLADAVRTEDEVLRRADSRAIEQAMSALSTEQRSAIEDAYFLGYSYSQVAERAGVPLGTIKSRIRAALRKLMDSLNAVGVR